ncbi:MAG: ABC transporter permease [Deltaproteobacteria bacterium]|nr:ABC transporter permease [Deltaproteobacteria bacterium]
MTDDANKPDDGKAPVRDAQAQPAATKAVEAAKSVEDKAAKDAALAALEAADKPVATAEAKPEKSLLDKALPLPAKKAEPAKVATPAKKTDAKPDPEDDPNKLPEAPPWWKTLRADPPAHISALLGIGLIAVIFLFWWFVTRGAPTDRIVSPSKVPSPGEVFSSFGRLMDRSLIDGILATLERVFKGVGLAALIGISVGVLAASHRGVGATMAPLVIFLRSVPMGALIPLTLMLFSDGEKQKWMFIFLAIVPFVFSDTVKAISIVPERYVETAQTLGASRWQIIRKVLLPLALPDILTSLRFQLGLALGYIMLVEIINAPRGIGALFLGSERQGLFEHTYLLLFVVALIAFTLDLVLRTLQRGMFAWRKDL